MKVFLNDRFVFFHHRKNEDVTEVEFLWFLALFFGRVTS